MAVVTSGYDALERKLKGGGNLTVAFVNDTGFIGGAGVAHRRQMQSFLQAGHDVYAHCWLPNTQTAPLPPLAGQFRGRWLGLQSETDLHASQGLDQQRIAEELRERVLARNPDLVICGNLHWAGWSISVLKHLADSGVPVIAFLHDCHWLTGRCAYTGPCRKYLTLCDETCPTVDEYPSLAPELIAGAWRARREVFTGSNRVPMFANSRWMRDMAVSAFHGHADVRLCPLGLDTGLFSPIDRRTARRLLRLPSDKILVLAGAVNLAESRKSGPVFRAVIDFIRSSTPAELVAFGAGSEIFPGVHGVGLIQDERIMPLLHSAADVMMHTAMEESFGQTLLEAAACGVPLVSFRSGGMVDIARDGENAITVPDADTEKFCSALGQLIHSADLRDRLGTNGRRIAADEYSLAIQYSNWKNALLQLSRSGET